MGHHEWQGHPSGTIKMEYLYFVKFQKRAFMYPQVWHWLTPSDHTSLKSLTVATSMARHLSAACQTSLKYECPVLGKYWADCSRQILAPDCLQKHKAKLPTSFCGETWTLGGGVLTPIQVPFPVLVGGRAVGGGVWAPLAAPGPAVRLWLLHQAIASSKQQFTGTAMTLRHIVGTSRNGLVDCVVQTH